ncbi:MAG: ATP-binding protein [Polyangiaceae bacterium]|nr:ATP-binding protein [Polyangiaceae bacterium]
MNAAVDIHHDSPGEPSLLGLVTETPTLPPALTVNEVSERWFRETSWEALAVVSAGIPLGLVTRNKLSQKLFTRFGHALFGARPIRELTQTDACQISPAVTADEALALAFSRPEQDAYDDLIVVDKNGRYIGMLSIKRLVLHLSDDLARVRQANAIAEARRREVERMSALRSSFLAHVTHELRSPTNTIVGLSELIESAHAHAQGDRLGEHVRVLKSSASHLRAVINSVLDHAKLEAGKVEVRVELVSSLSLLTESAEVARVLIGDLPVQVVVDAPVDVALYTDSTKLRQILSNLVSNAVKFTSKGVIRLQLWEEEGEVVFVVSDSGVGISEEEQRGLFQAFSQVGDVRTRSRDGTGLGLVISRGLAALLGGKLSLTSQVNSGTTVTLRLPLGSKLGATKELL